LFASGCKKPEPEKVHEIYFVPIGDAPIAEMPGLVSHNRQELSLESTLLPAFVPTASVSDRDRQQLIAGPPARSMHTAYAEYLQNTSSIRMGPLSKDWQFCFGWQVCEIRSAVVSTARMNLQ
jgi:hypothetical protein